MELNEYVLAGHSVEGARLVGQTCVEVRPALDQVEGVLRTFVVHLFKAATLFGEFIADLSDIDGLQRKHVYG